EPEEVKCAGFIVDEASMVGRDLYDALVAYNRPIIFVGDHGQLEPVGDSSFSLMNNPDVTLETVHRNAGEIARFADFIRKSNAPANWQRHADYSGERVRFLEFSRLGEYDGPDPDQTICAFNRTRVMFNQTTREHLGYPAGKPVKGDRVMCLQNDHSKGVYNGQQGTIKTIVADGMVFAADGEDHRVRYVPEAFDSVGRPDRDRHGRIPFDYAYVVTCHKAQGDEWDDVLVFEQRCKLWDHARWAYTAASRARRRLIW